MPESNRSNTTDEERDVRMGRRRRSQRPDPFGQYYGPGGGREGDFGEEYGNNYGYGREGERGEGDDTRDESGQENPSGATYIQRYSRPEYTELDSVAGEGPYAGVGPRGYQRSDARIMEDVNERLAFHGQIDASGIMIEVKEREVTLTGQVPDRRMKRLAGEVSGVTEVQNHLTVRRDR